MIVEMKNKNQRCISKCSDSFLRLRQ